AVSAAVQTARLNAAVTSLGVQNELDVISAAVIGGTSFSGGIGTIPGAVLGAVVMQSLRSGMVLLKVDAPVGGNGAGKSTLMRVLSGAHPANAGEIRINGELTTINNPRDARAAGI